MTPPRLALAAALLLGACSKAPAPAAPPPSTVAARETPAAPAPAPAEADAGSRSAPPEASPVEPAPASGEPTRAGVADAGAPAVPPEPDDARAHAAPAASAARSPEEAAWTAGRVAQAHAGGGPATLTAVRSARHEGFDRVVFEFTEGSVPAYALEYVDRPVMQCGSGEPVPVAGDGWLQVRFTGARAHTEQGQPTIAFRTQRVQLGVLRELVRTCDFEGEVTWVLGVAHPNRYRVAELAGPPRLVVDVRH